MQSLLKPSNHTHYYCGFSDDTVADTATTATTADLFAFDEDTIAGDTLGEELSQSSPHHRRHVKFGNIRIREYERTLGDNPAVSSGPPISLDWGYSDEEQVIPVEEYEKKKSECEPKRQLRMLSRFKREQILEEDVGVTRLEMKASMREVVSIQKMRKISSESKTSDKSAERMETFQRKLAVALKLRKDQKKKLKKLMDQVNGMDISDSHHDLVQEKGTSAHYDDYYLENIIGSCISW